MMEVEDGVEGGVVVVGHVACATNVVVNAIVDAFQRVVARHIAICDPIIGDCAVVLAGCEEVVNILSIASKVGVKLGSNLAVVASGWVALSRRISVGVFPFIPNGSLAKGTRVNWIKRAVLVKRVRDGFFPRVGVDRDLGSREDVRKDRFARWRKSPIPEREPHGLRGIGITLAFGSRE